MVTLEEQHSTRGRAHMLFELLQSEVVTDGWQDDHVKQTLDLCLSCKACKSECPANVDMATYRAEFMAQYYDRQRRPLHAYAFGMVDRWLRLGAVAPLLANASIQTPGLAHILKRILHVAPERRLPRLAHTSFHRWAVRHEVPSIRRRPSRAQRAEPTTRPRVILWVDTFNNYFHPETSRAALEVLQSAGYAVAIPPGGLCCGRPLYEFGFLDRATAYLRSVLDVLGEVIDDGVPFVVLEPGCASVFRDELRNLFPNDDRAVRLSRHVFVLSEFLESGRLPYEPPQLAKRVLLHGHCHQKALMTMGPEEAVLRKMGATLDAPDSGCCGMAGSFGFEVDKYQISQAIGERVLLPAVRSALPDTLIVADGFSCREQIEQATGRKAIHLAEVLKLALDLDED
jgi:Fe-S oxidoreductase